MWHTDGGCAYRCGRGTPAQLYLPAQSTFKALQIESDKKPK